MIDFKLGTGWILKLSKILTNSHGQRKADISKIADELLIQPEELGKLFVEPDLQPHNPADNLDESDDLFRVPFYSYVETFLKSNSPIRDGRQHLFILGDAGMGKTSVLAMLKLAHINSFFPKSYECVALKLNANILSDISAIDKRDKTLLLLDALDEDESAIDRIKEHIEGILKESQNFFKVIITCRTQFFPKTEDTAFIRQDQVKIGGFTCPVKYLSFFNEGQVNLYLTKKYSNKRIVAKAKDILDKIGDLQFRPMLLAYIDDLMVEDFQFNNAYEIYQHLVNQWLARECRKKTVSLKERDILTVCQKLARYMIKERRREISRDQLANFVKNDEDLHSFKLVNVGGRSLLNVNSNGDYRFSHQSFAEFLVVQSLLDNQGWDFPQATDLMLEFMSLCNWNGLDLCGAILCSANFNGVQFEGARLTSANLKNASLRKANLANVRFMGANLNGVDLSKAVITNADLSNCNLEQASLEKTDFGFSDLSNASLKESNCNGTNFLGTNLYKANFQGVKNLTHEVIDGSRNWGEAENVPKITH